MKEIGGYIELDKYRGKMLYESGIKLNSARNALAYIIKVEKIKKIYMPLYMCDACEEILQNNKCEVIRYHIGIDFKPILNNRDGWLYVVNFYGQLDNNYLKSLGDKLIVDNAQAYFQEPINNINTLYSCRKFFGVPDGAILYASKRLNVYKRDESFNRMKHILGRFEKTATEFYNDFLFSENSFAGEPIRLMSSLTENLLHALDYDFIKTRRTENFEYLHKHLSFINKFKSLIVPSGAYSYPLYIDNGFELRKRLIKKRIYVPTMWPSVFSTCNTNDLEYDLAKNVLPIPVDQRYTINDMKYIVDLIISLAKSIL